MDHVWIEKHGALTVVYFGAEYGSLQFDLLQQLRRRLEQLADDIDPPVLVLDFWNTDYFGAAFIGVLLHCYARIKRREGQFALCHLQSHLIEELEATNLHRLWPIHATREQGIEALTAKQKLVGQLSQRVGRPGPFTGWQGKDSSRRNGKAHEDA